MVFPGSLNDSLVANILQNRCGSSSPGGSKLTAGGQTALNAAIGGASTPWDSIFPSSPGPAGAPVAMVPTQCFDPVAVNLAKQFLGGSGGPSSPPQNLLKSPD